MTGEIALQNVVIRMGVFRALYASAVQFNSVLFRIIIGVLAVFSGIPAETVAIVTTIEFWLNGILEVPCGYFGDWFGRVPSIVLSLVLIVLGLACAYSALLFNNELSSYLFIAQGVLIGIGKPLSSGSIEAFYQDALKRRCKTQDDERVLSASLTTSQNYGKYFTTIAVVLAFVVAAVFNKFHLLPQAFLLGMALYVGCIVTLLRDYSALGDIGEDKPSSTKDLFKAMLGNSGARISLGHNLSFWMMTVVMAGYLLIAFGRELSGAPKTIQWSFMAAFMLGYSALGWALKGHVLPILIHRVTQKQYLLICYGVTFAMSLFFLAIYESVPAWVQIAFIFLYGMVFHTATAAIQNLSMNELMAAVKRSDYATALSYQNIPGFIGVGAYSYYLMAMRDGAPSVREAFVSVAIIALLSVAYVLIVERRTPQSSEPLE